MFQLTQVLESSIIVCVYVLTVWSIFFDSEQHRNHRPTWPSAFAKWPK